MLSSIITKAIGFLAGTGTTVSFFPQMIRVIRTKSVSDLSIYMFLIHSTGVSLWVAYGILVDDMIIVLFNCVTELFNIVILSFFIREHCYPSPQKPLELPELTV